MCFTRYLVPLSNGVCDSHTKYAVILAGHLRRGIRRNQHVAPAEVDVIGCGYNDRLSRNGFLKLLVIQQYFFHGCALPRGQCHDFLSWPYGARA